MITPGSYTPITFVTYKSGCYEIHHQYFKAFPQFPRMDTHEEHEIVLHALKPAPVSFVYPIILYNLAFTYCFHLIACSNR